jgi:hypothetical protein
VFFLTSARRARMLCLSPRLKAGVRGFLPPGAGTTSHRRKGEYRRYELIPRECRASSRLRNHVYKGFGMKICKLLLAAAGTTVLLGALVSSASARNFSISNQNIRASFREVNFRGAFGETRCQVTLEGSLHSITMEKSIGRLMGYITSAVLGPCAVGTATIHRETLPWHVRYSGFEGPLPNITSLRTHVIGASWSVREPGGFTCSARSSAAEPATGTYHRNTATHRLEEVGIGGTIRTTCFGASGSFTSDSARVSLLGAGHTSVFVSLI